MKYFGNELGEKQKELSAVIRRKDGLDEAKKLFLELHTQLFPSDGSCKTAFDGLFEGIKPDDFAVMPMKKDASIAWALWHITRIEDITANLLIAGGKQVFNDDRKRKLNARFTDTGNAMTEDEALELSKAINPTALLEYRKAVGERTREIVSALSAEELRRKPTEENLARLLSEGGLTQQPGSVWLKDYWGGKTAAGLILMPFTRHPIFHLNECGSIKADIERIAGKGGKFYR